MPQRTAGAARPHVLAAVAALVARGAGLIVCVDCGTAAAVALLGVAGQAEVISLTLQKAA